MQKFLDPLRGLGHWLLRCPSRPVPAQRRRTTTTRSRSGSSRTNCTRSLPNTTLWGYANTASAPGSERHLGGAIIAQRDRPVRIRFKNELPPTHILPVDNTAPGVDPGTMAMHNRVAVHLHGGHAPWPSDGGPWHWFGPGDTGPTLPVNVGASITGGCRTRPAPTGYYRYPNDQSARLMWYHDYAVGIDGYSSRDNDYYRAWDKISSDRQRFTDWLESHVLGAAAVKQ